MKPLSECRLYAFVDTSCLRGRAPETLAKELCDGGADVVQLRAKNLPPSEVRRMAEAVLPVAKNANVGLVINDHWDLACDIGADFCHLGQEDFLAAGASRVSDLRGAARPARVGLSTHAPDQALRAVDAGAHYIAIGPLYATPTKPQAAPVTLGYARWAAAHVTIPWFAIGGITLDNLDDVLEAGARRVCVVSAILNAPSATRACAEFRRRLDSAERG